MFRLETSRAGIFIDNVTPLKDAPVYTSPLAAPLAPPTPVNRTRFYTVGAPDPRYVEPDWNPSLPTIEYRADAVVEAAAPHFDSRFISPPRSIGINTPRNYFGRYNGSEKTGKENILPMDKAGLRSEEAGATLPAAILANAAHRTDSYAFGSSSSEKDFGRSKLLNTKPPSPSLSPAKASPLQSPKAPPLMERPEDSPTNEIRVGLDLDDDDLIGGPSLPPPAVADNLGVTSPLRPTQVSPSRRQPPPNSNENLIISSTQPALPETPKQQDLSKVPRQEPTAGIESSPASVNLNNRSHSAETKDTPAKTQPIDNSPPSAPADTVVDSPPPPTPTPIFPPSVPQNAPLDEAFQSQGAMSVAKSPLDISSMLEYYRDACSTFNATQVGANHLRCRLSTDADIDRLRMTLSAALSCSRALQQLSSALAHHPIAGAAFRLEEGKDVITDATFEKLVDLQASELNVLVQALSTQQQLLKGRTLAEDGLLDYQRDEEDAVASESSRAPNLETLAASLSKEASEAYESLQHLQPNAVTSEMSLAILCGIFENIAAEIAEERSPKGPTGAKPYLEAAGAGGPPAVDIPKLRNLLRQLATEHEQLSAQRGIAMTDTPNLNASASGPSMRRAQHSTLKYFVPTPPRAAYGNYFSNARRVIGVAEGVPATLEALKIYIKSLDQAKKSVLDPLELVLAATKVNFQGAAPPQTSAFEERSASKDASVAVDESVQRVKQQTAAASIIHASEVSGKRIVPQLRGLPSLSTAKDMLIPAVRWVIQTGGHLDTQSPASPLVNAANAAASLSSPLAPPAPTYSPQGLKEAFLSDLCIVASQYKKAFRRVCEMESLLLSFEDVTDAYVAACHTVGKPFAGGPVSRSSSQSASRSPNRSPPNHKNLPTDQALKVFIRDLIDSNTEFKLQVELNVDYHSSRRKVFGMLTRELRFLKKLDQVPLYFPPEYVVKGASTTGISGVADQAEGEEAIKAKLKLLKGVARANSTVAQSCLRTLANSMVTITKPDEDPTARKQAEEDNARRVPHFLTSVAEMRKAEEALSDALLKCRRYLARGGAVVGRPAGRGLIAAAEGSSAAVDGAKVLFGDKQQENVFSKSRSTDSVTLFGPKSVPISCLQAELFLRNLKGLIEGGVLIYLRTLQSEGKKYTFSRYAITFHPTALDRLLLVPKDNTQAPTTTVIPIPFAMLEMITRGAKVNDAIIGDLQTMRFHFDKKVVKFCQEQGPQQFNFIANTNPPQRVKEGGTVAATLPLLNKNNILEVYFPGSAAFQQWSDTFQLLLDNKSLLGPRIASSLGL